MKGTQGFRSWGHNEQTIKCAAQWGITKSERNPGHDITGITDDIIKS